MSYGIELHLIPRAMAEVLVGRADKWFQTSRLQGADWAQFRKEFLEFFLPPRYMQRLDDRIRGREQLEGESFKDFMLDLRVLMRHAGYTEQQELHRLYENSAPDLQMYIRRHDFKTIGDLTQLATELEAVKQRSVSRTNQRETAPRNLNLAQRTVEPSRPTQVGNQGGRNDPRAATQDGLDRSIGPGPIMDTRNACRNCGESGHFSRECRNNRQYFCWDCGRRGIRTVECCRRPQSGNGSSPRDTRQPVGTSTTNNPQ
ncbi:hypothetical protein KR084_004970 [Drosophila pseudotakahashii]|nr:hypothetical protein KR084_004970 [Drosophila pseudotakahashii]